MADDTVGKVKVLVYGTLKKDHANAGLMKNAIFMGFDSITGHYGLYDLGAFPAIVRNMTHPATVYGELYAIDAEGLAALDMLEGHPNFFRRGRTKTDRLKMEAWVYFLDSLELRKHLDHEDYVKAGIWRPRESEILYLNARRAANGH